MDRLASTHSRQLSTRHQKRCALEGGNVTDAVLNSVKGVLTVSHTSPRTNQIDKSGVVNTDLTVSHVSQELAQIQGPGGVVRDMLATTSTILNYKSRNVVVRRATRTKQIKKRSKARRKK